jgi:FtsP/CotA-like multicopper oxidase with cupredoxin domain
MHDDQTTPLGWLTHPHSRRHALSVGLGTLVGLVGARSLPARQAPQQATPRPVAPASSGPLPMPMPMPDVVGDVDHRRNGFNPSQILTEFDAGEVGTLPTGQTVHTYRFLAVAKMVEIAPGVMYPAWTYNGRIPGPTIRVRQGDRVRIAFSNATDHHHGLHFHGIHPAGMDASTVQVPPGGTFTYEFDAEPFGVHLYHCHAFPLAEHLARGLYGAFIVDPKQGWPRAEHEFVMVTSGFDVNFDRQNELYNVNAIPFHYVKHPIAVNVGALVRIFLVNILEYDPINSFHLHANFFYYYPTGTSRTPAEYTDTIAQMAGQRGLLEFRYRYPGRYLFHAHKTEFAELGWSGLFQVVGS